MSGETTWCCSFCAKQVTVREALRSGESAYDAIIPFGWAWAKYDSARLPTHDSRALGCSPDHARMAAEKLSIPDSTITITKVQE
jgi:hypothetical protein